MFYIIYKIINFITLIYTFVYLYSLNSFVYIFSFTISIVDIVEIIYINKETIYYNKSIYII